MDTAPETAVCQDPETCIQRPWPDTGSHAVDQAVDQAVDPPVLELLCDLDLQALLLAALEHVLQHDVRNLLHLLLRELPEHDDLVQAVEELWPEVALQLLVDQALDAAVAHVLLRLLVVGAQEEAEAAAALLDHAGTHVGGHDDERVLEVHGAALAVREAAVLQNLGGGGEGGSKPGTMEDTKSGLARCGVDCCLQLAAWQARLHASCAAVCMAARAPVRRVPTTVDHRYCTKQTTPRTDNDLTCKVINSQLALQQAPPQRPSPPAPPPTWSIMLNTSGCAFSISSNSTTVYGRRRTASVSCPPSW
jgi:hypothetical protein